jgi:hypothetical protein
MAIIKNTLTPHGVTASYHKLTNVSINVLKDTVEMTFAIYTSPEARDAGAIPLWNEHISYKLSELSPNPLDLLYPLALGSDLLKDGTPDVVPAEVGIRHVKPTVDGNNAAQAEAAAKRAAALAAPKPTFGANNGS